MSSTLVKFPVHSFRRIENPYDVESKKIYILVVNLRDIPKDFENWRKINVRDPKETSGVFKKIVETLVEKPESFLLKNRGMTIIASDVRFDNKNNSVEIEFSNQESEGLLDGGHTYQAIINRLEGLDNQKLLEVEGCVKIEILTGLIDKNEVVDIVEARNTSTQVKDQSIQELNGLYNEIKKVLEDRFYSDSIAYKEFEISDEDKPKPLDIKDILSYLMCFDKDNFSSESHPIQAYSSKSAVVKHFSKNHEKLSKYIHILPTILELRDRIYLDLPEIWNNSGGRFGGLYGVETNKEIKLYFKNTKSQYLIPSGFYYPILASFRALLDISENTVKWKKDPFEFYDQVKKDLIKRVGDMAVSYKNPQKLGKDKQTWLTTYDRVENEILRQNSGN